MMFASGFTTSGQPDQNRKLKFYTACMRMVRMATFYINIATKRQRVSAADMKKNLKKIRVYGRQNVLVATT